MCGRLQYYCLVQIISRIGATWYQLQFGFVETVDMSNASSFEMAVFSTQFILTPSAGIGYLIVFLVMQPEAYQHFKDLIQDIEKKFHCKLFSNYCCFYCIEDINQSKQTSCCQSYCCPCFSLPTPLKKTRKVIYRMSEETATTLMEQRLVEDIMWRSDTKSGESGSENAKRQAALGEITVLRNESFNKEDGESYSSSYFIDDQDLEEELERMYREGKCGVPTI